MCEDALVTMLDSSMATFFTGSASPRWWWLVTSTWARPASSTGKGKTLVGGTVKKSKKVTIIISQGVKRTMIGKRIRKFMEC